MVVLGPAKDEGAEQAGELPVGGSVVEARDRDGEDLVVLGGEGVGLDEVLLGRGEARSGGHSLTLRLRGIQATKYEFVFLRLDRNGGFVGASL